MEKVWEAALAGPRRDRVLVLSGIVLLALLAWTALAGMVAEMAGPGGLAPFGPGMVWLDGLAQRFRDSGDSFGLGLAGLCLAVGSLSGPYAADWSPAQAALTLAMWLVMALAMMLPTAAPMIAAYADITKSAGRRGGAGLSAPIFVAGYLAAWGGAAAAATAIQWGLHTTTLLTPHMVATTPILAGLLLILAGAYQWSALKQACLSQCRSPLRFFMAHWRGGRRGGFAMGLRHGLTCVGCCWALMALMFVGGAMNLVWMALLAIVMLLEKVLPRGAAFGRAGGLALAAWGLFLVVNAAV